MSNEPLITAALITAIIAGLVTLLRAFGVPITQEQQDAINQFMAILAPLVVAAVARQYVTPVASPRDSTGVRLVRDSEPELSND